MSAQRVPFFSLAGALLFLVSTFLPMLNGCGTEISQFQMATERTVYPKNIFFLYPAIVGAIVVLTALLFTRKGFAVTMLLILLCLVLVAMTEFVTIGAAYHIWANEGGVAPPFNAPFAIAFIAIPIVAANFSILQYWKRRSALFIIGACYQVAAIGVLLSLLLISYVVADRGYETRIGLWLEIGGAILLLVGSSIQMKGERP